MLITVTNPNVYKSRRIHEHIAKARFNYRSAASCAEAVSVFLAPTAGRETMQPDRDCCSSNCDLQRELHEGDQVQAAFILVLNNVPFWFQMKRGTFSKNPTMLHLYGL